MDEIPNYSAYNWELLQDARAHINRERYPINFAALEEEMTRRQNRSFVTERVHSDFDTRPPIAEIAPVPTVSSNGGRGSAFSGWLAGVVAGGIIGHIWFLGATARLRASGVNPYDRDDWAFGWLSCQFFWILVCSLVGLFMGISRAKRG